jgi:hypothetical protein
MPELPRYRIRVRGHLDPDWWDCQSVIPCDDGTTTIVSPVADASALYGLLARLRDRGATLLQVERLDPEEDT